MKLISCLIFLAVFQAHALVYSQNSEFTISESGIKIKEVLKELENKSSYRFFYSENWLHLNDEVNIEVKNETMEDVLKYLFDNSILTYKVFDNNLVVIVPKEEIAEQQVTVKGMVTGASGEPLPGVNVVEKGTNNGAVTDLEGSYTINVNSPDAILTFSFVGYLTEEIEIAGRSTIDVVLVEDILALDEVVVTALGIKKESKALGYAVSKVDSERILASGTPTNALQSLYGSAAGVQVAGTATGPTGGMKINIRNAVSFDPNSTTRPLIVVDGVPIHDQNTSIGYDATNRDNGTGINDINPDDISSFEILKGAKASVLYGSEGANGVILITTKGGTKSQGLGVTASVTTSWDNIAFMPELQNKYGTGRSPSSTETDAQGYFLDENNERTLDYSGGAFGPKFDPSVTLNWWDGSQRPWVAQTDNIYDDLFRQGRQTTSNIALSSGNETGNIRFSYTNTQLSPTTPSGKFEKNTFSVNATYNLNKHISVKYTGNYYISNNLNAPFASSFDAQGARTSLGAYSADIDVDLIKQYLVTEDGYNYFANPNLTNFFSNGRNSVVGFLWDQGQNESSFTRVHNIQSLTVDLKINETFSVTALGGMDVTNEEDEYRGMLQDPSLIGPNSGSSFVDSERNIRKLYGQGMFNFDKDISNFNLSGFVGGAIRHNELSRTGARQIGGMVIPNYFSFTNLPSGVQPIYQFENGEDILYSILGSAQLEWNDQIYVEAQARQDWSSILPPENNSYFYPGVSATWIANNTFDMPSWVQFAKLRASWADVGKPGPRYFSNVNYNVSASGSGYILSPPDDLPPMDENGRPNLKPERKREFEVGLESYLFSNQRIGVDFSYYTSKTYDQIMAVTAPPGFGVSKIRMNAAEFSTKGWEMTLKTKPLLLGDFSWDVDITFASSTNQVEKLDGELKSLTLWSTNGLNAVAEVGGEYGLIYQQRGFQHYINPSDPNDPKNGKQIVQANGESYNYATTSSKMVGKLLPDLIGGLFTTVSYKNIRLIANMDYSFGAFFISEGETYMMAAGVLEESLPYRDQESGGVAYHKNDEGVNVLGEHPSGGETYHDGVLLDGVLPNGEINDRVVPASDYYYASYFSNGFFPEDRLFKSDYIALRNIAIDYTIPSVISSKLRLNELTLSVFGNNIGYLYKDAPNTIPESSNGTGWNNSSYGTTALPTQRSFGVSIKVKL